MHGCLLFEKPIADYWCFDMVIDIGSATGIWKEMDRVSDIGDINFLFEDCELMVICNDRSKLVKERRRSSSSSLSLSSRASTRSSSGMYSGIRV